MKALLVPNFDKPKTEMILGEILKILITCSITPLLKQELFHVSYGKEIQYGDFFELITQCDFIISVGGDGTILHAAKHAVLYGKPVVGINTGRLGFLAQVEIDNLDILKRLATKEYKIHERILLKAIISGQEERAIYALNDIVISKGALARMVDLQICCDGSCIGNFRADGMIFSTPTGCTAYSLSAGGPIVDPKIEGIIMTPICPHSLVTRSTIFSPGVVLTIRSDRNTVQRMFLTPDGENYIELLKDSIVTIQKAEVTAKFISFDDKNFYQTLSEKINTKSPNNDDLL